MHHTVRRCLQQHIRLIQSLGRYVFLEADTCTFLEQSAYCIRRNIHMIRRGCQTQFIAVQICFHVLPQAVLQLRVGTFFDRFHLIAAIADSFPKQGE